MQQNTLMPEYCATCWHGALEHEKWIMSEQAGYDVGTPTATDRLIAIAQAIKTDTLDLTKRKGDFHVFVRYSLVLGDIPEREQLIRSYFIDSGRCEEGGRYGMSRIEAEIRRFEARIKNTSFEETPLSYGAICMYSSHHRLGNLLNTEIIKFFEKIGALSE